MNEELNGPESTASGPRRLNRRQFVTGTAAGVVTWLTARQLTGRAMAAVTEPDRRHHHHHRHHHHSPTGPTGSTGPTGATGPTGMTGPTGDHRADRNDRPDRNDRADRHHRADRDNGLHRAQRPDRSPPSPSSRPPLVVAVGAAGRVAIRRQARMRLRHGRRPCLSRCGARAGRGRRSGRLKRARPPAR